MAITRWSPVRDLVTWRNAMERAMEEAFGYEDDRLERNDGEYRHAARLPLDVYSTEEDIFVVASVPGVDPDGVEIMVEGETLTIQGELTNHVSDVNYIFAERYSGRFARSLKLNVSVDVDKIAADFDAGVLTIRLPKSEAVRPKVIKVNATK